MQRRKKIKKTPNKWIMNLYIKDIRNLVAANMSLDKNGKLFNLKVSKLCFPYEKATYIKTLKNNHEFTSRVIFSFSLVRIIIKWLQIK
jgi:Tfp pilus assembly protein PilZ